MQGVDLRRRQLPVVQANSSRRWRSFGWLIHFEFLQALWAKRVTNLAWEGELASQDGARIFSRFSDETARIPAAGQQYQMADHWGQAGFDAALWAAVR